MDSLCPARVLLACLVLAICPQSLALADSADTPKHLLAVEHMPGELTHVEMRIQVGGDLKLVTDTADPKTLPMSVVATIGFDERLLRVDRSGHPASSLRYYTQAGAVIKVDQGGEKPSLSEAHRLVVANRPPGASPLLYSLGEPISRQELDLIDTAANTLVIEDMLPPQAVAIGQSWKASDATLAALIGLDAVSFSDVECVLGGVNEGIADLAAAGSVSGAAGGVSTEIELKAKYRFHLQQKRISYFALLIKEKRAIGHIGPGLDTVAKVLMVIHPLDKSQQLTSAAAEKAARSPALAEAPLRYTAPGGQFRFDFDRRWYVTGEEPKLTVMRLLDRGELVAQCNISAMPSGQKTLPSLAEFQRDVQRSLGDKFGQFVSAAEDKTERGYQLLRVVANGTVAQLPIQWIYYLVSDDQGRRVSLAFTMEQELVERFAHADRTLVRQLEILEGPSPTPAATTPGPSASLPKSSGAR